MGTQAADLTNINAASGRLPVEGGAFQQVEITRAVYHSVEAIALESVDTTHDGQPPAGSCAAWPPAAKPVGNSSAASAVVQSPVANPLIMPSKTTADV